MLNLFQHPSLFKTKQLLNQLKWILKQIQDDGHSVVKILFFVIICTHSSLLSAFPEIQPDFKGLPVVSMNVEGQKVWFKQSGPEKIGLKGCFKKALTAFIPIPTLRPTYYCSQQESFENEISRINTLANMGVPVPYVLKRTENWIALTDLGETFDNLIKKSKTEDEKINLIQKATLGLAQLHTRGQYHGRGVLRDIILTPEGKVGFIDFEENPPGPLIFKQARDLLMHLYSVAEYSDDLKFMQTAMQTYQTHGETVPFKIAIGFLRVSAPFIQLFKFAPLGRDGVRLLKAQALSQKALELNSCQKNL